MGGPIPSPPDSPNTTAGSKTICSPMTSEDNHPDTASKNTTLPFGFKYRCSPTKSLGSRNVYNVSSATLTSYTTHADGDSLDASLPNHMGLPVVKQKHKKSTNSLPNEKMILSSLRNFLVVLALSIHSIFEGMAIGLQENNSDVWKLFAAVIVHAVAIQFCIGTEMITMGTKKLQIFLYMFTLASVTSLGIIIGMVITDYAISDDSGLQTLVIGLLQGLAGGTLLYITFYEVLDKEKLAKLGMTGLGGCLLLILGFSLMAGLEAVGGHSHGPAHHGHEVHQHHEGGHDHHDHHHDGHTRSLDFEKRIQDKYDIIHQNVQQSINSKHHEHGDHDHENHEDHEHEDHEHEDHDHEDHDHDHEDHEHEDHELEDHEHEDHEHEDHDHGDHHD